MRRTEDAVDEDRKSCDHALASHEHNGFPLGKNEERRVLDAVGAAKAIIDVMLLRVRGAVMRWVIRIRSVMGEIFVELDV